MWVESALVVGDQIVDAADLDGGSLTVGRVAAGAPRMLLAHVQLAEDAGGAASYLALTVLALEGDIMNRAGTLDLLHPLLTLSPTEQQILRGWLIGRHWPAWARAAPGVRALLGDASTPIVLAAAARAWMLPLPTLSGAAVAERLPTTGGRSPPDLPRHGRRGARARAAATRARPPATGAELKDVTLTY